MREISKHRDSRFQTQKLIEIDDERTLRGFYDKRMGAEISADSLGDEFKGYVMRIAGGNDKQGFAMKQGILSNGRVRLLMGAGCSLYRCRRSGERHRRSARGCIVGSDLSVLNLVIVKKGEGEIPGLTDRSIPRRLGPKRANNIRKMFNLEKADDVTKYVVRREVPAKGDKPAKSKAPKIQRLVTPITLQRKRRRIALKKKAWFGEREKKAEYLKMRAQRAKEAKDKKAADQAKRREARKSSAASGGSR